MNFPIGDGNRLFWQGVHVVISEFQGTCTFIAEFQGTFTCIASQHRWGRSCRAAVAQWRHPGKPVAGPEAMFPLFPRSFRSWFQRKELERRPVPRKDPSTFPRSPRPASTVPPTYAGGKKGTAWMAKPKEFDQFHILLGISMNVFGILDYPK